MFFFMVGLNGERFLFLAADAGQGPGFEQHVPIDMAEGELAKVIEAGLF
jgi:hypothetical protein